MKVFLTGERGVGKSTLVQSFLKESKLSYSGVKTSCVYDFQGTKTIYLQPFASYYPFTEMKAGRRINMENVEQNTEVFDTFGVELLSGKTDFIVIDEVGNLESNAEHYTNRLINLLEDGKTNIIGVLQKGTKGKLADSIVKNAQVIEITKENRDSILSLLCSRLCPTC